MRVRVPQLAPLTKKFSTNTKKQQNMTALDIQTKHQNMVRKLAKSPMDILESLSPHKTNILHMAIGLLDEYFELQIAKQNFDRANIIEELGDMLFYTEGLIFGSEKEMADCKFGYMSWNETMQMLGRLVKRNVFYEQDLNIKDLTNIYKNLKNWIQYEAGKLNLTIVDIQEHNMTKLLKRYPDYDYSDHKATVRQDKLWNVMFIDNIDKTEVLTEYRNMVKEDAENKANQLNQATPETETYYYKATEQI